MSFMKHHAGGGADRRYLAGELGFPTTHENGANALILRSFFRQTMELPEHLGPQSWTSQGRRSAGAHPTEAGLARRPSSQPSESNGRPGSADP
jgi:hypothetical protein